VGESILALELCCGFVGDVNGLPFDDEGLWPCLCAGGKGMAVFGVVERVLPCGSKFLRSDSTVPVLPSGCGGGRAPVGVGRDGLFDRSSER
jgi:hypothetical protein